MPRRSRKSRSGTTAGICCRRPRTTTRRNGSRRLGSRSHHLDLRLNLWPTISFGMSDHFQRTITRNARVGMLLFVIYVIFYAGFVAVCAFSFTTMQREIGGVNLAILYGLGLIFLAL